MWAAAVVAHKTAYHQLYVTVGVVEATQRRF
nr:MAG TPA: hypothetical protein [Caudoviricetes sp.]